MASARPSHRRKIGKDMLAVWTQRCAKLWRLETGADCGSCPDYDECERQADRRIAGMYKNGRRPG
jgi:hypothetical protein